MSTEAAGEAKQETVEARREKTAASPAADEDAGTDGTAEPAGTGERAGPPGANGHGTLGPGHSGADGTVAGAAEATEDAGEPDGPGASSVTDAAIADDEADVPAPPEAIAAPEAPEVSEAGVDVDAGEDAAPADGDAAVTAAGDEDAADGHGAPGGADEDGAPGGAGEDERDDEGDGDEFPAGGDDGHWDDDGVDEGQAEEYGAGRARRWPRVLLVTGFVLAAAAIVGGAIAIVGSVTHGFKKPVKVTYKKSALFSLKTGDCFDAQGQSYSLTSCDDPHQAEVFATFSLAGQQYPGSTAIAAAAGQGCASRLTGYLNPQLAISLASAYVYPDATAWKAGTRTVICEVRTSSGDLTGSVRGASATAG
jgi:hypothetical protein